MANDTDLIARTHFDTAALRPQDRYDAWSDSIAVLYDVEPTEFTMAKPFEAEIESFMIGSMMAATCRTKIQAFSRSKHTIARDGMDHILLQFYLAGGNTIKATDGYLQIQPGDIQIIDMAQETFLTTHDANEPKTSKSATEYCNLSLFIARDKLEELVPSTHALHHQIIPAGTPLNAILRNYIMSMYQSGPQLSNADAEALMEPTVELLAASLGKLPDTVVRARRSINQAVLLSAKKYIRAHLHLPDLNPDMIARHLGISRASLFRLCKPLGGVQSFIQQQRLLRARRMLSGNGTGHFVKSVAYSLGFKSATSFTRAYKDAFGFSPSETLELYASKCANGEATDVRGSGKLDRRYEYWMSNLVA